MMMEKKSNNYNELVDNKVNYSSKEFRNAAAADRYEARIKAEEARIEARIEAEEARIEAEEARIEAELAAVIAEEAEREARRKAEEAKRILGRHSNQDDLNLLQPYDPKKMIILQKKAERNAALNTALLSMRGKM
tara:strand:- start:598 stop:1002 length:405 start_codon:yes stop_codon:yes gene_type:complete